MGSLYSKHPQHHATPPKPVLEREAELGIRAIIFGPPGSGKGTHASALSEKYHACHLSTGMSF